MSTDEAMPSTASQWATPPVDLVLAASAGQLGDIELPDVVRAFQSRSLAANTIEAYTTDLARFTVWCRARGLADSPATPETVATYIAEHAAQVDVDGLPAYSAATITRWVSSINKGHRWAGFPPPGVTPVVESTLAGIRRTLGRARPTKRAKALLLGGLRSTLAQIPTTTYPDGVAGRRDKALLLIGFGGALRADSLVSLVAGDVQLHDEDGLHVRLRYSKTDQEGAGRTLAIPFGSKPLTCAACAFTHWTAILAAGGRAEIMRALLATWGEQGHVCRLPSQAIDPATPLFPRIRGGGAIGTTAISTDAVSHIVRRRMAAADLNPEGFSGHSLRAGFVTQAQRAGASHHEVMAQTGHKDPATVELYAREANPLANNAVTRLGL